MPRKTKDVENNELAEVKTVKKSTKTSSNSSDKKSTTSKKSANSKATKKANSSATKSTTSKSSSSKKINKNSNILSDEKSEEKLNKKTTSVAKKTTKKETAKTSSAKEETTKRKSTSKKSTEPTTSKAKKSTKVATSVKSKSTKKATKKDSTKTTSSKRKTTDKADKKATTKKFLKSSTTNTSKRKSSKVKPEVLEYYDLPYRYNETIVKILAQTPKKLFVYWDISDEDRQNYINNFGVDFFNNTKPVLKIINNSMNYSFEIEINDFANCLYLDVNDTKCNYTIELGRRPKISNYYLPNNYVYVSSSNVIENPNDHILFEKLSRTVYFRNVKNNNTYEKNIANMAFIRRIGKIYNIYDAYKKLYNEMYNEDMFNLDLNNPSSGNPTSTFK